MLTGRGRDGHGWGSHELTSSGRGGVLTGGSGGSGGGRSCCCSGALVASGVRGGSSLRMVMSRGPRCPVVTTSGSSTSPGPCGRGTPGRGRGHRRHCLGVC